MGNTENPKYQQLVHTAWSPFMKYGIRRVSVEEICREAGVSKMTYYKYFKNKTELVKCLINQFISDGMDKYRNTMDQDIPYTEKVKQVIQQKFDGTKDLSREFPELGQSALYCVTEVHTKEDIDTLVDAVKEVVAA